MHQHVHRRRCVVQPRVAQRKHGEGLGGNDLIAPPKHLKRLNRPIGLQLRRNAAGVIGRNFVVER